MYRFYLVVQLLRLGRGYKLSSQVPQARRAKGRTGRGSEEELTVHRAAAHAQGRGAGWGGGLR